MRLLTLALLAALAAPAWADVPARVYPSIHDTGATREQPQALSHWQHMARQMARQAAPQLQHVAVSSVALGQSSMFDVAFHDFFITALHQEGVRIVDPGHGGARVEIDTFPLEFHGHRRTARVHDVHPRPRRALRQELSVSVRIIDAGELVFSGSQTYYIPAADWQKYRSLLGVSRARTLSVQGE